MLLLFLHLLDDTPFQCDCSSCFSSTLLLLNIAILHVPCQCCFSLTLLNFDTIAIFALRQRYLSCSSLMLLVLLFPNAIGPTPQQCSSSMLLFPLLLFDITLALILGTSLLPLVVAIILLIVLACPILD